MLARPTYTSFCDVSATVSCTQVYASRFGTFQGISVSVFGGIWFALCRAAVGCRLDRAARGARERARLSVCRSTLALAVILYLGYASFVILKLVCVLCLITYAAVIGLFLISGAATSFPMLSLPRRAAQDLKVLVTTPAGDRAGRDVARRRRNDARVLPARGGDAAAAGAPAAEPITRISAPSSSASWRRAPRMPLVDPERRRQGADRQVRRLSVPGMRPGVSGLQADFREVRRVQSRRGEAGPSRTTRSTRTATPACDRCCIPAACDAAVAVRLAAAHGRATEMEDWLYTHQQEMTPETVRQAAREVGQVTDFDAKYAPTLELGEGRHRARPAAEGHADADLLHQRHQDRRRVGAAVLRPGDRLRARARSIACTRCRRWPPTS